jgi:hypothetical protein
VIPTGNGGLAEQGVLGRNTKVRLAEVLDGTSNTFLCGELSWARPGDLDVGYRPWTRGCTRAGGEACPSVRNVANAPNTVYYLGGNTNFQNVSYGSNHPGVTHFLLCDASTRLISKNISMGVLLATASRDGGESTTVINN